jgi:HK97 family phage major capsid protein
MALSTVDSPELTQEQSSAFSSSRWSRRPSWMMPSRTFIALRKLEDTSNQYLLQPDVTARWPRPTL